MINGVKELQLPDGAGKAYVSDGSYQPESELEASVAAMFKAAKLGDYKAAAQKFRLATTQAKKGE